MSAEMVQLVIDSINEVFEEMGLEKVALNAQTNILVETPLDSIGLAIVVVKMEEKTQKDPFATGFITFNSVDELAKLYAK